MKAAHFILWAILSVVAAGCNTIGPGTVPRDRAEYSTSIAESWKRQTLLNIVKLRYMDPPIFVDVGQIVAGYSMQTGATINGTLAETTALGGNLLNMGASGIYTDRPTITYTPLTGNRFMKAVMTPLPPSAVLFTIQAGFPADGILFATTAGINGLRNQDSSISGTTPADPKFLRLIELIRKVQLSGGVALRVKEDEAHHETTMWTFRSKDISDETLSQIQEVRSLLHLNPDTNEFRVVYAASAASDDEVAILTRSVLHIMMNMASQVEVPDSDVREGRALPGKTEGDENNRRDRLVRIHCTKQKPDDAYVVVPYRNQWFWIDDKDLITKRALGFIMMLFPLADTGDKEPLPLVTIPAQ